MDLRGSPEKACGSLLWSWLRCLCSEHSKLQPLVGRSNACLTISKSAWNSWILLHPSFWCKDISSLWSPIFFISLTILSKSNAMSLMMGCPSQAIDISWQNYTNGFEIHFPPLLRSTVVPKLSILSSWDKTGSLVDDSEHITKGRCLGPPWCQMGLQQQTPV